MKYDMRWDIRRTRLIMAIVWRLPRWLVYWCAVRVGAHATTGVHDSQVAPDLKFLDALKRWNSHG